LEVASSKLIIDTPSTNRRPNRTLPKSTVSLKRMITQSRLISEARGPVCRMTRTRFMRRTRKTTTRRISNKSRSMMRSRREVETSSRKMMAWSKRQTIWARVSTLVKSRKSLFRTNRWRKMKTTV